MKTETFLSALDEAKIVGEIAEVEKATSGEVRVFITHHRVADPFQAAAKHFLKLGMEKTRERNAVLLFFAPKSHKFAVIGDRGVHEKCGEQFWKRLVEGMREHFRNEKFSHALVEAIEEAGKALASHFPKTSTSSGELSNEVIQN